MQFLFVHHSTILFLNIKERQASYCTDILKLSIILLLLYRLIGTCINITAFFTKWQRQDRLKLSDKRDNCICTS